MQVAPTHYIGAGAIGTITGWVLYSNDDIRRRPVLNYTVAFDEPQYDEDGDGPYPFSQIPVSALSSTNVPPPAGRPRWP